MSGSPEIQFKWSDAWLLVSIWCAGDSGKKAVPLKDVIGMGDAINHAMFTAGELRNGLARLTSAGFVSDHEGQFSVMGKAREFLSDFKREKQRTAWGLFEDTEGFLKVDPHSSGKLDPYDPAWPYPSLTDEIISKADKEYTKEFWKEHRELEDKNRSPLSRAYFKNKKDVKGIGELIQQGMDINVRDADKKTVLMHAVFGANKPMVEYLLENGADVNLKDDYGETALHFATWKNSEEVVKLLLARKPQMNPRNSCGGTPLWKAVKFSKGKGEVIKLLLAGGADKNAKDNDGVSPLELARKTKEYDLLQFFK